MARLKGLSLSQQWLLIATVTMVPVLTVVAYASWSLYHQLQLQRVLLERSDRLDARHTSLNEGARDLERFARQYRLLRDDTFLEPYAEKYQALIWGGDSLNEFLLAERQRFPSPVTEPQHKLLTASTTDFADALSGLEPQVLQNADEDAFASSLNQLSQSRVQLDLAVSAYTDALSDRGEQALQDILGRLFLMGIISLPVTLALMGVGFWQMIRPIRRLSQAIRDLGHGDWDTPIAVAGPRDFQALGERLEWMREQLLEADSQKQAFLRHVSHELKTPLSAIVEAGSLLQDQVPGPLNFRQESVLRILLENSQNLQELIQQLLNYNVITHSEGVHSHEVDMTALCQRITQKLDQQNLRHSVIWDCEGRPEQLEADPQLLEMILSNLLSNAYHYSPAGGTVTIRWGVDTGNAWIRVADEGPGVLATERDKVFQPFVQGRVKRHGSIHGSGVGLAIVRESVARLGGEVRVEPAISGGSCFSLWFPQSTALDKEGAA